MIFVTRGDGRLPCRGFAAVAAVLFTLLGGAASAAGLEYAIKPDQVVAYRVTIEADTPTEEDAMTGLIGFTGQPSQAGQSVLDYRGGLERTKKGKRVTIPRRVARNAIVRVVSPTSLFENGLQLDGLSQRTNKLTLGRGGQVSSLVGQSKLPYLLGNLSVLPFEPLPPGDEQKWQFNNGWLIAGSEQVAFPRGPLSSQETEARKDGAETADYSIERDDGKLVTIRKIYRLSTPAIGPGFALDITGAGMFVFNRELGAPESLEYKEEISFSRGDASSTASVSVVWKRVAKEEYEADVQAREAKLAADRAEAEKKAAAARAERERELALPLDARTKRQTLADLRSDNWARILPRLHELRARTPHPDDVDVAIAIRDLQNHSSPGVRSTAKQLWEKWSVLVEPSGKANSDDVSKAAGAVDRAMRTWTDVTGTFHVEATFVRSDGDNVVLKTADGREISVPILRLSEADQAYVKDLSKTGGT